MSEKYDLLIIGAGPGGYTAAIHAAQSGMSVALVEEREALGGTCANVGCIPSKALLHSTELYSDIASHGKKHGIIADNLHIDIKTLQERKDDVVNRLTKGVGTLMKHNKVTVLYGLGWIIDAHTVEIRSKQETTQVHCEKLLLATGSEVQGIPSIPFDGKNIISSDEALELRTIPKELVIIGAGVIGLELGSVWARLGSKVTLLEGMGEILPGWDKELARSARKEFEKQGLNFVLNARVSKAETQKKKVYLHTEDGGDAYVGDNVLVAVGRKPRLSGFNLESLDLAYTPGGRSLAVDENYQTSVENVYAIGDIIPGPMLAHKALEEAVVFIERINGVSSRLRQETIPNVVYTAPELASVGKTEEQLKEENIEYAKSKSLMSANGRSIAMDNTTGFVKVLASKANDRILGIHIFGPQASHLIAEAVSAMDFDSSSEDLRRIVHAHPTLSEVLKEASMGIIGKKVH